MMQDIFSGRLLPGERVVWSGAPYGGLLFVAADIFAIPFSLMWCGFAIFWEASVAMGNGPIYFKLWGLPFVCIGLYFVFGRFVVDAWVRRGLRYAVTDRRILIARAAPFSRFTALQIGQLPDIDLKERADGRGTIRFGQRVTMLGNRGTNPWSPALDSTPQFLAIEGARRVFDLIQKAQPR